MATTLKRILAERATVMLRLDNGDDVELHYNPSKYTPRMVAETERAREENEATRPFLLQLERLLLGWDVMDETGQPLAITEETLSDLPYKFLLEVMDAITKDALPDPKRRSGQTSRGSFS